MAVATSIAVGVGVAALASGIQAGIKKKAAKEEIEKQAKIKNDSQLALEELEKNRQDVINPAANMANEYANLGVATEAAKFQAEEADIALANTLDTIAQTGGGAGGATALARMALESKKGISASIETQEAANQKMAAEGAAAVQSAKAQGETFKWAAQEDRDNVKQQQLLYDRNVAENREIAGQALKMQANMDMIGAAGTAVGGLSGGMTGLPAGDQLGGLFASNKLINSQLKP